MKHIALALLLVISVSTYSQTPEGKTEEAQGLTDLKPGDKNTTEFKENYARAIRYYNAAVEQLINKDTGTTAEQSKQIQSKTQELFKQALPYFEKCHEILPDHEQVKKGLAGCRFALGMVEKEDQKTR